LLLAVGVPVGPINNIEQLIEHPQVKARGGIVDMSHPRAGPIRVVGVPVRLSETPGAVRTPSPGLGEHTAETLRDLLGLSDEEVERLIRDRVVQQAQYT
jgi:crotonobetainyl-CoA:carnitine CoA-transferase CaiB-like acyl-CoA transferase